MIIFHLSCLFLFLLLIAVGLSELMKQSSLYIFNDNKVLLLIIIILHCLQMLLIMHALSNITSDSDTAVFLVMPRFIVWNAESLSANTTRGGIRLSW